MDFAAWSPSRTIFVVALVLSIGCSGDGTFESPDSIEVTTPQAVHGQIGRRADIMVAREGEEIARQVVLVLRDSDVSDAPMYVVMGYTSGAPHSTDQNAVATVELIDFLHTAVSVALVPSLPKGTEQKGGILYGNGTLLCYLRVTTPSDTLYWSVRASQERIDAVFEWLAKPPEVLDTMPATVLEVSYYSDQDLTAPLTGTVYIGDTIYTKVVFSKSVPIVIADDDRARPIITSTVEPKRTSSVPPKAFQYRMKARDTGDAHLLSGDAKPYLDTENAFICKYVVEGRDFSAAFRTHVNHRAVSGDALRVDLFTYDSYDYDGEPPTHLGETTAETITAWGPDDFVGRVYLLFPGSGRLYPPPVAGVTVTIVSGPRAGEHTVTDINGRYLFLDVAGDTLRLRVERAYLEPKEVIVHRSRPTALASGAVPNYTYSGDVQGEPGNILMGYAWPDAVRPILEETLLPHDLLYLEDSSVWDRDAHAGYIIGIVRMRGRYHLDFSDPFEIFWSFAHEIGHAHQDAIAAVDGSSPDWIGAWRNSPEAKAFSEALERDLAVDFTVYDNNPYYRDSLEENAAHTFGWYWYERLGGQPVITSSQQSGKTMKDIAPNRYEWVLEWMLKK